MRTQRWDSRLGRRRAALWAVAAISSVALVPSATALAAPGGNSAATISGSFADSCRDFAAHSSKDISHVELHYADGRVVKDERIDRPDYSIDGGAGEEIEFAIVKSGTTSERFDCVEATGPPTALLEINTPPIDQTIEHCFDFSFGGLACEESGPRTDWTDPSEIPNEGGSDSGYFHWVCGAVLPCPPTITASFRGIGSSDPDDDISSWSLDFGDGTSASGSWASDPPTSVFHDYGSDTLSCGGPSTTCVVVLTVTDAAGQSESDTLLVVRVDQTPD
jgi:hypothetical protein